MTGRAVGLAGGGTLGTERNGRERNERQRNGKDTVSPLLGTDQGAPAGAGPPAGKRETEGPRQHDTGPGQGRGLPPPAGGIARRYLVGLGRENCSCQVWPPSAVARITSGAAPPGAGCFVPSTQPVVAAVKAAAVGLDSPRMAGCGPRGRPASVAT